jgi:hypothetical protein
MLVGALAAIVNGVATGGRLVFGPIFVTFLVFMALLGPKKTVTLENIYTGQTRTVANVPLGVAFVGDLFTGLGYWLTETTEAAFSYPGLTQEGLVASLEHWRTIRLSAANPSSYGAANSAGGGDFAQSWINYVSTCTSFGGDIGALTPDTIQNGIYAHEAVGYDNRALGAPRSTAPRPTTSSSPGRAIPSCRR